MLIFIALRRNRLEAIRAANMLENQIGHGRSNWQAKPTCEIAR